MDQISVLPPIPQMPAPHFASTEKTESQQTAVLTEPETQSETEPDTESKPQAGNADVPGFETVAVDLETPERTAQPARETADPSEDSEVSERPEPMPQPQPIAEANTEEQTPISAEDEATILQKPKAEPASEPVAAPTANSAAAESLSDEFTSLRTFPSITDAAEVGRAPVAPPQAPDIVAIPATQNESGDVVHDDAHAASQPRANVARPPQTRSTQQRKQRDRAQSVAVANEGPNSVTRKYRIDVPGGESTEAPEEPATTAAGSRIQSNSPTGGQRRRIDDGQPLEATLRTGNERVRTQDHSRQRYIDEPHGNSVRGPHYQVTAARRSNLTSITGQFLAYLGVLGLTIGTAIVIYGHFGGYSDYTPTGWLVTTVAQMMLFLGVINLVSGGIEQTNDDVSARINTLGEQLMRIEQVTEEALRGPKISARRYMDPDAEGTEPQRETATLRERD